MRPDTSKITTDAVQSILAVILSFTVCGSAPDDIITTCLLFLFQEKTQTKPESLFEL